jgi:hypothetical protein
MCFPYFRECGKPGAGVEEDLEDLPPVAGGAGKCGGLPVEKKVESSTKEDDLDALLDDL